MQHADNQRIFWYVVVLQAAVISGLSLFRPIIFDCVDPVRLCGTYGNPMVFGAWLSPLLLLLPLAWIHGKRLHLPAWFRLFFLPITMVVVAAALYQTLTRGAVLGVGAGLLVAALIYFWRGYKKGKIYIAGFCFAAILVSTIVYFAGAQGTVQNIILLGRGSSTVQTRIINWKIALKGFKDNPILGRGPENYRAVADKYFDPALLDYSYYETRIDKPHNMYLETLVASGIVGLLAYLLFITGICYTLLTRGARAFGLLGASLLVGSLVALQLMLFVSFETYASLAALSLLILLAAVADPGNFIVMPRAWAFRKNRGIQFVVFCFAIGAIVYGGVLPVRAAYFTQEALNRASDKDFAAVAADVQTVYAAPAGPYDFEVWQWTSGALLSPFDADLQAAQAMPEPAHGLWLAAVKQNGQRTINYIAANKNDSRWELFGGKAAYHTALLLDDTSYLDVSEKAFLQAQIISPYRQEAWDVLTYVYMLKPKYPAAIASVVQAVRIRDNDEIQPTVDALVQRLTTEKEYALIVDLFQKLLAIHPTASRYAHLAATYAVLHKNAEARAAVQSAVDLDPSFAPDAEIFLKQLH